MRTDRCSVIKSCLATVALQHRKSFPVSLVIFERPVEPQLQTLRLGRLVNISL